MLELTSMERLALAVMREGRVPEHVAFIMDGNRRFGADKNNKALSGHEEGALTLKKCLLYCLELGIKCTSFYAFSIENYKRAQSEVEFLMNLARHEFRKLSEIYQQDNILTIIEKNNVKVIIAGDLEGKLKTLFPDVREGFLKIQERTKNNTKMIMYLCFAYDSVYEYNRAVELSQPRKTEKTTEVPEATEATKAYEESETAEVLPQTPAAGEIEAGEREGIPSVSREQQKKAVFSNLLVPRYIDILIRTSGESRLSNYMLMQANYGLIYIEKNLWPAFNMFSLGKILLQYNYYYNDISCKKLQFAAQHTTDLEASESGEQ